MNTNISERRATRPLIALAALVVVVAGMRAAEAILVPFLLSVFLAIICAPPLLWLKEKKVPTAVALATVIAGITLVLLLVGLVVGDSVQDFTSDLPRYQQHLQERMAPILEWLSSLGVTMPTQNATDFLEAGRLLNTVAATLTGLGGALANTFLIILTVIFILLETSEFTDKLRAAFGPTSGSVETLKRFTGTVKHYMALKTIISLATGVIITVWLWIIGVDFPVLWGLLAFLFNYVPNIGSIIAALPAVLLAFIQLGPGSAGLAALGYLVVNSVIGNMIEPRVMGQGLGLSTLVVFISLVFWGWVLGPVGMFLSVPLTMTIKIGLESAEGTRPIAILLGSAPEPVTK